MDEGAESFKSGSTLQRCYVGRGLIIRVKKPTRVTFLESREGVESLFTRGLRLGAIAAGWDASVVFLANAAGAVRSDKAVRIELLTTRPDTVCFLMDAPLHLPRLWEAPSLAAVDKVSLWFDDYYRSPKTLAHPEIWTGWQKEHGVRVGIWDAYWRCHWKNHTGGDAFPIRLAADPKLLSPDATPFKPEWKDRAAFVGTIPSLKSLEVLAEGFPRFLHRLLEDTIEAMRVSAWPIRPYELARKCQSYLGTKYSMAIDTTLSSPEILALWHMLLWRWGKRIARLRGLAAIAQSAPLAVMSGHGTEAYADESELRKWLPSGSDLVYADTKSVPAKAWKGLFHTGKFQVQITDPQSVEGGLPFRVFEAAACAMPLLSDYRAELANIFPANSGMTLAANEAELTEAAARIVSMAEPELRAKGREMYKCFQGGHTWEARWTEIAACPARRSAPASLSEVNWKPARPHAEQVPQAA